LDAIAGAAQVKYDILNRFSGAVQFSAEIECEDDASTSVKLGLAVKVAIKAKADLIGANLNRADLSGTNLSHANLTGADLTGTDLSYADLSDACLRGADLANAYLCGADVTGAYLIDGGQRSDGYRFVGWIKEGVLQIRAGCRSLSIADARTHWDKTRGGTPLGDETFVILNHIEKVARIRKLVMP
jgi:hypothetical protein